MQVLIYALALVPSVPSITHSVVFKFSLQKSVRRVVAGVLAGVFCWLVDNSYGIVGIH